MKDRGKRLCFVVQRYGHEVTGGAETLCREVAHRLSDRYRITILTTCALDYLTWENHYPAGLSKDRELEILRFPTVKSRKVRSFGRLSIKLYNNPHTPGQEMEWMEKQGPDTPDLYRHIQDHREEHDLWIFFTYLYTPTFFGLPKVADRAVLVPMAHPEEPLEFDLFDYLFHLPRGMIFNTPEERSLVHRRFRCDYIPSAVAGLGIDLPGGGKPPDPGEFSTVPYLLYTGRLDVQKGLGELFEFFTRYSEENPDSPLQLLLAGDRKMRLPEHPKITYLGYLPQGQKDSYLAGCLAAVVPSPHESLSVAALEAWAHSRPVLANGHSAVLAGQCLRSGGGRTYINYDEFRDSVDSFLEEPTLREELGSRGLGFVSLNYSWSNIQEKYQRFIDEILEMVSSPGEELLEPDRNFD
jgi:glycosyltransferase involved in cell wall biosynthesis